MRCCCECHCEGIPSRDAMNDRLYWVEIVEGPFKGYRFTAWRDFDGRMSPWTVSVSSLARTMNYTDDEIRIIHQIIPED